MNVSVSSVDGPEHSAAHPRWLSRSLCLWLGLAALAAITAFVSSFSDPFNIFVLNSILIAVIGAVALNLLWGTAGQASVGNAGFLAVGAFAEMYFVKLGVPFPVSLVLSAAFAALVGIVIGIPALRLVGLYLILATLAAHFIILFFAHMYQDHTVGTGGFIIVPQYASAGLEQADVYWAWTLFAAAAAVIVIASRLAWAKTGRAWRLIREHELIAPTLGINTVAYKLAAFAISAGMIGLAGALQARFSGSVTVEQFTFVLAIQAIAIIFIGGLDSILGSVLGAAIITYLPLKLPELIANFLPPTEATANAGNFALMAYGLLIVVCVTTFPRGVAGFLSSVWRRREARQRKDLAPFLPEDSKRVDLVSTPRRLGPRWDK